MANVTQIYALVNDAASDFIGSTGVRVKDTTSFVDFGRSLADLSTADDPYHGYDAFFGALVSRIAKTEVFVRLYEKANRKVLTDYHEFGAFIQKIYTSLPSASGNGTWSVSNGENPPTITPSNPYNVSQTIAVSSMIFGKFGTWSVKVNRPTRQIKMAFLDEASMQAFIDAIYVTISTDLNIQLEALENLAVSTAIANAIDKGKATNLLQVYNTGAPVALTVSTALESADFLAFANKFIDNMRGYMKKPSTKYNPAGYTTFTGEDKMVVECLTEFASASKFYLEANSFNANLVAMQGYNEVPYWQSPGTSGMPAFADISKVDIKNSDVKVDAVTGAAVEVSQAGIICVMRDEDAVKAYFGDRRSWELVNPEDETVIHGEKADLGYGVDPHANIWVFYIADAAAGS